MRRTVAHMRSADVVGTSRVYRYEPRNDMRRPARTGIFQKADAMTSVLKVNNVPTYISEAEFKRVWNQPGLECQSCHFVKGPNSEYVSVLHNLL